MKRYRILNRNIADGLQSARTNCNRLDDLQEQFHNEKENLSQAFDSSQKDAMQRAREELEFHPEKSRILMAEQSTLQSYLIS